MKYMGSKNRIAKYIIPIMLKNRRGRTWVEPFVGGGNMIDKVDGNRIGSDNNVYLVDALKLIRDNVSFLPKDNTETDECEYKKMKLSNDCGMKGYYGFALSYGGKWFGGWCRDGAKKRDYVSEAYRNAIKQSRNLKGTYLYTCDYYDLEIPKNSIIYCDPPYANVTKYKDKFNHNEFWEWCRTKSKDGHDVYISEYNAPEDFECIWQKEIVSSLTKNTGSKTGIEKLFIYKRL